MILRHRKPESGQAAIFMTLSLIAMLGLMGLVVDVGWAYWRKEAAKTAAQSAAFAAIMAVNGNTLNTCNANGVTCQNETACPASPTTPPSSNMINGCLYAKQNGFINSGRQTVTMTAHGPDSVAPPVSGISPAYWVSSTVTESIPQLFSAVLGQSMANVKGRATAAIFTHPANACIYALAPSGTGLGINGNVTINSGCGIYIDSNNATAALTYGGSSNTTASVINVVGGYAPNGGGTMNPLPTTGAPYTADPLAAVTQPSYPSRCDSTGLTASSSITMPADGFYVVCDGGFSMNGSSSLNLPSGTYVIKGGSLDWKNGTLTNSSGGVTFFFTGAVNKISINGNMNVTLNAPTSGALHGMLFFQDRSTSFANITINGGSNQILNGSLYFPTSDVSYSGGSSTTNTYTALIGWHLSFVGNSYFINDLGGTRTGLGLPTLAFVE